MNVVKITAAVVLTAAFFIVGGCTPQERSGYSPIPQNTPGSWELRPYGELRN